MYEYCATPVRLTVKDMPRDMPEAGGVSAGAGARYTLQPVCKLAGVPPGVAVSKKVAAPAALTVSAHTSRSTRSVACSVK